jgi:hypothetical protein
LQADEQEKKMTYITSVEEIGFKRAQEKIALKLLQRGISPKEVASITELSISELERFAIEQIQNKDIQSQQK